MKTYRDTLKIASNRSKMRKFSKNWKKNRYYMHFDSKKYTKNYKMKVIYNKEDMISYYQLKEMGGRH